MDFLKLAQSRHSVRSFLAKEVPHQLILTLLEAARYAPSGGNFQPWHFFVITDSAVRSAVYDKACKQPCVAAAPLLIVVCADIERNAAKYGVRGQELYCIQDTAAAIENILLCAKSLELGACWCGSFKDAELSSLLKLGRNLRPVAILPIGYQDAPVTNTPRRKLEEIATFI